MRKMDSAAGRKGINRLLRTLSASDAALIGACFELVTLAERQVLEAPHTDITNVYFVESGLVSIIGTSSSNRIEVAMVGYEGMTGLSVVLGSDRSANETMVQSSGTALRISAQDLRETMQSSASLRAALLRYVHVLMMQASQTALANGRGLLEERLARWLLMWSDRLRSDTVSVTHEFLSLLLGVRRPGVTVALHELEGRALIKSTRTRIQLLHRAGLVESANGYYGIPEAEYERTMRTAKEA